MKYEVEIIEKYFNIKNKDSRLVGLHYDIEPLILMVNDKEEINKDILVSSDCKFKNNYINFLAKIIIDFRKETEYKNDIYTDIIFVLKNVEKMEDRYEINSEEVLKRLLDTDKKGF